MKIVISLSPHLSFIANCYQTLLVPFFSILIGYAVDISNYFFKLYINNWFWKSFSPLTLLIQVFFFLPVRLAKDLSILLLFLKNQLLISLIESFFFFFGLYIVGFGPYFHYLSPAGLGFRLFCFI
jgi:hypothetical protein